MKPNYDIEESLLQQGFSVVVGLDEVGRGCLAGMVTVGAVHFPDPKSIPPGINDSKLLTPRRRVELFKKIQRVAHIGIGSAGEDEIDRYGLTQALLLASTRALSHIEDASAVVLDGKHNYLPRKYRVITKPKADQLCLSVAAASIIAKVTRDNLMRIYDEVYPGYDFGLHKGYASAHHRSKLAELGPSQIHRMSFAPLNGMSP